MTDAQHPTEDGFPSTAQALLFDLDGTLIDSSASVGRAWRRLADRIGRPFAELEPVMHGMPVDQVLRRQYPDMPEDEVRAHHAFMVDQESTDTGGVVAQPGAQELLAALPADRWAVVTSCGRRLAAARIAAAGLPVPPAIVTADDVPRGKPAPDPFLAGAAAIGVPPQECLVLEDAPAGVAAARAAGCAVVGVLTTHDRLDAPTVVALRDLVVGISASGLTVARAAATGAG
ncbi:HAD-IA family hydrolase [Nakamurella leprariae]|uniref:HAD-IA family hydrolase n=1 Tax=Nakamurella leprariae TaxID=2803911 RepID=A0A938YDT9_9ACTN|nr:HAD-IA family hydrolase [Nakamurella leprariae]MBM9466349.1 HAD-IA family hydrolase [Nakamurella leprariae]